MTADQPSSQERAQGIASALAEIDPNTIQVRTEKLDGFLNGLMLPFVGLHVAMIGTLILGDDSPDEYKALGFVFLLVGLGIAAIAWLQWRSDNGQLPRQAPSATFCFLLAAAVTLPWTTIAAVLIALLYGVLALLVYRKVCSAIEIVFPSIYVALFEVTFWSEDFHLALLLFVACFAMGGATLARLKKMQYAIGLLIGAAILLVSKIQADVSDEWAIGTVAVLFAAAGGIYELLVGGRQFSNLRHFLSQGVVALLFLVVIALVMSDSDESLVWIWVVAVAIYSGIMVSLRPNEGVSTRAGWIAITILIGILMDYESSAQGGGSTWGPMIACLGLVVGLAYSAKHLGSAFVHNLSQMLLVLLGLLIYVHIRDIEDAVLPSSPADVAGNDPAALSASARENRPAIVGAAVLVVLAYITGYIMTRAYTYPKAIAWWRGLIRPRHAVIVRKLFRAATEQVQGIPFVGGFLTAILVAIRSLRYLKGGSAPISFGDLVEIALNIFVALSATILLKLWLVPRFVAGDAVAAIENANRAGFIAAWVSWGILLYLRGVWSNRAQLVFLGVGFVVVPPVKFMAVEQFPQAPFLAAIFMTSGLALCLFGLVRRSTKKRAGSDHGMPPPART